MIPEGEHHNGEEEHFRMLQRRGLHDAITNALRQDPDNEENVVSGWIVIVESVSGADGRVLSVMSGDATGEVDLLPWTAEGWVEYVAKRGDEFFTQFDNEDDEEDEEFSG